MRIWGYEVNGSCQVLVMMLRLSLNRGCKDSQIVISYPFIFHPEKYNGIAVLRLSTGSNYSEMPELITLLAKTLVKRNISGKLWVVQKSGVREYTP